MEYLIWLFTQINDLIQWFRITFLKDLDFIDNFCIIDFNYGIVFWIQRPLNNLWPLVRGQKFFSNLFINQASKISTMASFFEFRGHWITFDL